eukprot:TRINITY_DN829_c0_g4_i2.p1 TRINITY_DN829_c0_g4~~TRINITY_DN829_c0_g4_i2.p1  ORF type:complete len:301 (+),score=50.51 TRINITY_DN829_c0_g4_i2:62-964(+)
MCVDVASKKCTAEEFAVKTEDEIIKRTMTTWTAFMDAMQEGTVADFYDSYVAPKAVWESKRLIVNERVQGKEGWLQHYNNVLAVSWGGEGVTTEFALLRHDANPEENSNTMLLELKLLLNDGTTLPPRRREVTWAYNETGKLRLYFVCPADSVNVPTSPASYERPCHHNSWDSVRVKRNWCLLRCRYCQSQWRLAPGSFSKCTKYTSKAGCSLASNCPNIHLNVKKLTAMERLQTLDFAAYPEYLKTASIGAYSGPFKARKKIKQQQPASRAQKHRRSRSVGGKASRTAVVVRSSSVPSV